MKTLLPMKKFGGMLVIAGILTTQGFAQTPINNGSFEIWEDVPVAFVPDDWEVDKNYEVANQINTRVAEATNGTYSLKLTTVEDPDGSEPYFGFAVLGEVGESGPVGGILWTETVDELKFDAKYDIQSGDTGYAMVEIYDNTGTSIGGGSMSFTGSQTTFATQTLSISYFGTPAEIMIGFVSGNYIDPVNIPVGSWIQIDNVRLFNGGTEVNTSIPNFSFESWSDYTIKDPQYWTSTNMELSDDGVSNVISSTDAIDDYYAAEITNIATDWGVMTGALFYGDDLWNNSRVTYTDQPEFLTGAVKYTPAGIDTAFIYVTFENTLPQHVGGGGAEFLQTSGYHEFVMPMNYYNLPATVNISILAGRYEPHAGSVLLVDNLQFVNGYNVYINVYDGATPSNPISGAQIVIPKRTGDEGTTDFYGHYSFKLPNGTYDFTVTHGGYNDYTGSFTVAGAATSVDVQMTTATALPDINDDNFRIYPNPVKEVIYIETSERFEKAEVIDVKGTVVKTVKNKGDLSQINVAGLAPGQYILKLFTDKEVITKQIIVGP
jgi:hypothetical protein